MRQRREIELMLECCRLYYENGESQDEVARSLGLSRPKVSRLLQRAREEGIVQIRIVDPFSQQAELEAALTGAFPLRRAIVAAGSLAGEGLIRKRLGWAAASYLESVVRDGQTIGLGWGRTLHAVVQSLARSPREAITVVPLVGGLSRIPPSFQVNELARLMAEALGGTWLPLYTPAFIPGDSEGRALLNSPDIRLVTDRWAELDLAVVGIGHFGYQAELRMLFADYVDSTAQQELEQAGAVGDICARFFDLSGRPVTRGAWPALVSIDLGQLRALDQVVAVAGGPAKVDAILGALRGGYVDVLITDEPTARLVLDRHREER